MAKRRVHAPEFKAQVALEALSSKKTLAEVAAIYKLHPVQVCQWKQQIAKRLPDLYRQRDLSGNQDAAEVLKLQISKLESANAALLEELAWLKKKFYRYNQPILRSVLEPDHHAISMRRQCDLVGMARSSYYYSPTNNVSTTHDLARCIDYMCMLDPAISGQKLLAELQAKGIPIHKNYLHRLLCHLGFAPFERRLTKLFVDRCAQPSPQASLMQMAQDPERQWILDIAYWPTPQADLFAALIVESQSQRCLAWGLSDSLSSALPTAVLQRAMQKHPLPLSLRCETFLPLLSDRFLACLNQDAVALVAPLWLDRQRGGGAGRATLLAPLWRCLKQRAADLQFGDGDASNEWVLDQALKTLPNPLAQHSL
jgi:putative transposase